MAYGQTNVEIMMLVTPLFCLKMVPLVYESNKDEQEMMVMSQR